MLPLHQMHGGEIMLEHSAKFETVKRYYVLKVWNETRVRNAVEKSWITPEEFEEITGKSYR